MLRTSRHRPLVVGSALLLALVLSAPRVRADWDDRSGSLPGIGGIGSVVLLAAGGVGAFLLARHFGRDGGLRASPSRLEFEQPTPGASVTLSNHGSKPLQIVSVELPANESFVLQPLGFDLPATLARDQSLTVRIGFDPRASGRYSTALTVMTSDGNRTRRHQVRVAGRAQALALAPVSSR
jgi:hypothetical protein